MQSRVVRSLPRFVLDISLTTRSNRQASSTKLPLFLSFLLDRLSAFLASHPSLPTDFADFISSQQSVLQPILDAPRPNGRSTLFNSNIAGGLALPGMGVGGGAASDLDRQFSKVAKETAEGLKSRLKCVSGIRLER